MAKTTKKKNRKLKRQIRKTVGALLMVSAITVAAVPVPDVRADEVYEEEIMPLTAAGLDGGTTEKVKVLNQNMVSGSLQWDKINGSDNVTWQSEIPYVPDSASIYTDYNGRYRFAFVPNAKGEYVAVILGANIGELENYTLTIDPYVDAYKKYSANTSDLNTLCAVTRSDKFLYYYKDVVQMQGGYIVYTVPSLAQKGVDVGEITEVTSNGKLLPDENGKLYYYNDEKDAEGNDITVPYEAVAKTVPEPTPCLRGEYNTWINETLYYISGKDGDGKDIYTESKPDDGINGRLYHADVAYIGRQYIEQDASGDWKIKGTVTSDNPERGVFAGNGNIRTLNIPSSLLGIGDYAFFRCGYLSDVKLGNGLSTIGNGAFAYCNNMKKCDLDIGSRSLHVIGKEAFLGCSSLESIRIPLSVDAIGDYCFRNCINLKDIDMSGGIDIDNYSDRLEVQLTTIGYRAFEGCTNLDKLVFPDGCTEKLPVSYFKGCDQLRFISTLDRTGTFDIIDGDVADSGTDAASGEHTQCEIAKFLADKPQFYFEGYDGSEIQKTAHLHSAAFSYIDTLTGNIKNEFEKLVRCSETPSHPSKYVVNKDNQLIGMDIDPACGEINIPSSIGPYSILEIAQRGFENNCKLKKIVIPSSIHTIGERAFGGCHNLEDVIFQSPVNSALKIGTGAFDTQDTSFTSGKTCAFCGVDLADKPVLTFTADICLENSGENTEPFTYAMDPANNINVSSQKRSYITFYSGWPTNLTVEYNPEKDINELIDYPKFEELGTYAVNSYPDMTKDRVDAAKAAYETYMDNKANPLLKPEQWTTGLTPEQIGVINSALNITLPRGIEGFKTGIFSGVDSENKAVSGETPNDKVQSITMHSVKEVEPYAFANCPELNKFYANELEEVGSYAFIYNPKLENVDLGGTVTSMGIRPFAKCDTLKNVGFTNNPNFVCSDAIIYGLTDGAKSSIVECLETRGQINPIVGPDELTGVTSIAEEAFKDCQGVITVDLSSASVRAIPRECFSQSSVSSVNLSKNTRNIGKGAFWNSKVASVRYPSTISYIEPEAFANVEEDIDGEIILDEKGDPIIKNSLKGHSAIKFYYPEGEDSEESVANIFAGNYYYIDVLSYDEPVRYTVYFWDNYEDPQNPKPLGHVEVLRGEDAVPPEAPVYEGVVFKGWFPSYKNVQSDNLSVYTQYGRKIWTVRFCGIDGTLVGTPQEVEEGMSANPPKDENGVVLIPQYEGWTFTHWADYSNIGVGVDYEANNGIVNIMAQGTFSYSEEGMCTVIFNLFDGSTNTMRKLSEQKVPKGTAATAPSVDPIPAGYVFSGWSADFSKVEEDMVIIGSLVKSGSSSSGNGNSGSGGNNGSNGSNSSPSPSPSVSPTPEPTPGVKKYTVSVSGGSGSGEYAAGEIVAVNAYYMGEGQVFDKWTSSTAGVGFSNPNATSATFTMPAANVAVTATYKTGSGNSVTPVSSSGGGSNTVNTVSNNGTVVDITRPGISNTNLAGATVSGATDNFIVKVTEDQIATDAATAALQARYGDLSRIKYLPMDISLYDSTGRTKIADTSGISVNLTIPLPDELVQYAGNNRVAAISGGMLEDLNARFTTVGGVPCVNFTATHFSPYVIYVDTANLSEAVIDATPKTGDPIHPKWFLAIGLACISLILFFKRDKVIINTKTA